MGAKDARGLGGVKAEAAAGGGRRPAFTRPKPLATIDLPRSMDVHPRSGHFARRLGLQAGARYHAPRELADVRACPRQPCMRWVDLDRDHDAALSIFGEVP